MNVDFGIEFFGYTNRVVLNYSVAQGIESRHNC